jgi:hypothetical protein
MGKLSQTDIHRSSKTLNMLKYIMSKVSPKKNLIVKSSKKLILKLFLIKKLSSTKKKSASKKVKSFKKSRTISKNQVIKRQKDVCRKSKKKSKEGRLKT